MSDLDADVPTFPWGGMEEVAVSPDGTLLAAAIGGPDMEHGELAVWYAAGGAEVRMLSTTKSGLPPVSLMRSGTP